MLHVLFLAAGDPRRRWRLDPASFGFSHGILGHHRDRALRTALLPFSLRDARPDAVVASGFSPAAIATFLFARRREIPIALWSGAVPRRGEDRPWRRYVRRKLARRSSACLVYGTAARDYLLGFGVPPERVFRAWNTVDVDRFAAAAPPSRDSHGPLRLLAVGTLDARKRVDLVIRAVARAREKGGDLRLTVVGDGRERGPLERLASRLEAPASFAGHRAPEELPAIYAAHDAFAFASDDDVWGLVLIEAMAAGLPCFASVRAGATRDAVEEGRTGFALDFHDTEAAADRLLTPRPALAAMGRAAQARARSEFSLDRSADAWVEMVRTWRDSE